MGEDPILALPGIRVGRAGVEKFHDMKLRGRAGAVQMEVNAVGRVIRELDRQEGSPGQDVGLTIDLALQKQVLARLGDQSASAVVMDCRNGEVLAMTTTPSFDPSLFNSGVSQAQWVEWTNNRRAPLINKATSGVYPPGSTFKMAVAMAGLENKVIGPGDRNQLPGLHRRRRHPVPLLEQERPRIAGRARRSEELVRRVLLRVGAPGRHRPAGGDGKPVRHRRGPGHRAAGHPQGADADQGSGRPSVDTNGESATP